LKREKLNMKLGFGKTLGSQTDLAPFRRTRSKTKPSSNGAIFPVVKQGPLIAMRGSRWETMEDDRIRTWCSPLHMEDDGNIDEKEESTTEKVWLHRGIRWA
jgi:hypothetical protein